VAILTGLDLSWMPLVDGHCHTVVSGELDDSAFEMWCTEASSPPATGASYLDSQLGLALRRWCAPALGLPPGAPLKDYLRVRRELGHQQVLGHLLSSANLSALLVDTGLSGDGMLDVAALGEAAGAEAVEVIRLETLAERVAAAGTATGFAAMFVDALNDALTGGAVAIKSILAYRHGLDIDAHRPTTPEVTAAAGRWIRDRDAGLGRLTDPVLLRFLLWCAVDTGRPVQLHTGFGDRDVSLVRGDPALLQPFCAATQDAGTALVLLHCYPYHRNAGWLAQIYPHVYVDLGLTVTYLGARFTAVVGEFLELAPFGKVLFSSDAYGLPELYLIGAAQLRHGLGRLLGELVDDGAMGSDDAFRVAYQLGGANANRLYQLSATAKVA
jgi:predicted TIM-barrel fold metal-dependent hydrolase